MLQETRQHILEILKNHGELTVDELVEHLYQRTQKKVTGATVRHHLDVLRSNGLIAEPAVRHRDTPGRPQYTYHLSDVGLEVFPSNYAGLANVLLAQIKQQLPVESVNVILEGAAQELAANAVIPDAPLETRLAYVVEYLSTQGYEAHWSESDDGNGYILQTSNCPFEKVATDHDDVCKLDMYLISNLLGVVPRRLGRIAEGEHSCDYFIPNIEEPFSV